MRVPRNLLSRRLGRSPIPVNKAQACDNDRFPCPIVSGAPSQGSAEAVSAAPAQPSKKKPTQAAQKGGKPASAKSEGDTAQAPALPNRINLPARTRRTEPLSRVTPQLTSQQTPPARLPLKQSKSRPPCLSHPSSPIAPQLVRTDSAPARIRASPRQAPRLIRRYATLSPQQAATAGDFKLAKRNEVAAARLRYQPAGRGSPVKIGDDWAEHSLPNMVRWLLRTTRGARPGLVPDADAKRSIAGLASVSTATTGCRISRAGRWDSGKRDGSPPPNCVTRDNRASLQWFEKLYRERRFPFKSKGFCEWGAKPQIKEFRNERRVFCIADMADKTSRAANSGLCITDRSSPEISARGGRTRTWASRLKVVVPYLK